MNLEPEVVIMDDDVDNRHDFSEQLRKSKLKVNVATTPRHLHTLLAKKTFDAGIIDIRMSPGGSEGLGVIRELKQDAPDMYLEVHTGYDDFIQPAQREGAHRVFKKPEGYKSDAAERIKKGIYESKISNLGRTLGLNLSPGMDNGYLWDSVTAAVLTTGLKRLDQFFETDAQNYGIPMDKIEELKHNTMAAVLEASLPVRVLGDSSDSGSVVPSPTPGILVSPELMNDLNYLAYQENKHEFEKKYKNQYVALINGVFVCAHARLKDLYKELSEHRDASQQKEKAFIKKIDGQKKIVNFARYYSRAKKTESR